MGCFTEILKNRGHRRGSRGTSRTTSFSARKGRNAASACTKSARRVWSARRFGPLALPAVRQRRAVRRPEVRQEDGVAPVVLQQRPEQLACRRLPSVARSHRQDLPRVGVQRRPYPDLDDLLTDKDHISSKSITRSPTFFRCPGLRGVPSRYRALTKRGDRERGRPVMRAIGRIVMRSPRSRNISALRSSLTDPLRGASKKRWPQPRQRKAAGTQRGAASVSLSSIPFL
jgi:hypothetical protein